jgi:hypothetical protein
MKEIGIPNPYWPNERVFKVRTEAGKILRKVTATLGMEAVT